MKIKSCNIENCNRKYYGLGYCELHYYGLKTYGDPLYRKNSAYGQGFIHISRSGKKYRKIFKNGKVKFLHREIMEKHIGRELNSDEVVHHIDGNGLNNDISNLVLCKNNYEHFTTHTHKISKCWKCQFKLPKNNDKWCEKHKNNYLKKCHYGKFTLKRSST